MYVIRFGYARCTLVRGKSAAIIGALRFKDPSAFFTREFQEGLSDGKKSFYDRATRSFPTGFLPRVEKRLKRKGKAYRIEYPEGDKPVTMKGLRPDMLFGVTLGAHQFEGVKACVQGERGWLWHATNAGKTAQIASVCLHMLRNGQGPWIVMVPNTGLLHATAKDIRDLIGGEFSVAKIGDGKRGRGDIVVATTQSLVGGVSAYVERRNDRSARRNNPVSGKPKRSRPMRFNREIARVLESARGVFIDEGHHAAADTWKMILDAMPNARFRFGVTGTMRTKQRIRDVTLQGFVGPLLHRVRNRELMDSGWSAEVMVYAVKDVGIFRESFAVPKKMRTFRGPTGKWERRWVPDGRVRYKKEIEAQVHDRRFNKAIAVMASSFSRGGLKPMIQVVSLKQLATLKELCTERGLNPVLVFGDVPGAKRTELVRRFTHDPNAVLIGSTVMDEGFNAPAIGVLFITSQGKSEVKLLQRTGRGVRRKKDGLNLVALVDMMPVLGEFLPKHADERLGTYKDEGFEVEVVTDVVNLCKRAKHGWKGLLGERRYERERAKRKSAQEPRRAA